MSTADPVVISSFARTPMGGFQGALAGVAATDLGATAVKAAVERAGVAPAEVDRVYMGCVLPAGLGQAPARPAALKAGLPQSVQATTVNKVCGSGMQAAIMAAEAVAAGTADVIVAGGMESMTNSPFVMKKHRAGARMGHDMVYDSMMQDGLEDAYTNKAMGLIAEDTVTAYQFTREAQDNFALESLSRANAAIESGAFAAEIAPVTVTTRKGEVQVTKDEQPGNAMPDKIPGLKPAFKKDGTITAANASSISDGAAALVITRESVAKAQGLPIEAKIVATAAFSHAPEDFTTAPVPAIKKVLELAGWSVADVDLFEINEAFAMVTMVAMQELGLPRDKVNVNGGATALGHPIGASGARIITTLVAALKNRGLKKGIASLCIGGGEATAIAVELA